MLPSFNSRTPGGVRRSPTHSLGASSPFQFTHPGRGATNLETEQAKDLKFQFTHPGRGATEMDGACAHQEDVSIHAPREGCDTDWYCHEQGKEVSIHAPREGCDVYSFFLSCLFKLFQFTHPGRGATGRGGVTPPLTLSFNSRTPGGVRPCGAVNSVVPWDVSIHAPREGCDFIGESCFRTS